MVMVKDSAGLLKGFLQDLGLGNFWTTMAMRIVLAFVTLAYWIENETAYILRTSQELQ